MAKPPVIISHPDKIFWPDDGYTKLDLAEYYAAIFSKLRPYVDAHILSLERCPDGMRGQCFYQKEKPKSMPPGTATKRIRHAGGSLESTNYVVGGSLETQLALVNLGCIAVHVMAGRSSAPRKPDWLCFDLDPSTGKFADAAPSAGERRPGRPEARFLRQNFREPRHPYFRAATQRPRCGPGSRICSRIRRARRRVEPQRTHGRTFRRGARPARLSRPVPQRIRPDSSRTLFDTPSRQGTFFSATGVVRSENQPQSRDLQPRQLPQTLESERPLGGFFQKSPKPERSCQIAEKIVASPGAFTDSPEMLLGVILEAFRAVLLCGMRIAGTRK